MKRHTSQILLACAVGGWLGIPSAVAELVVICTCTDGTGYELRTDDNDLACAGWEVNCDEICADAPKPHVSCFACAENRAGCVFVPGAESGACCLPKGECLDGPTEAGCTSVSGAFAGIGTTCAETECLTPIPTVSEWGLIVVTLLGLTIGTIMLARRRSQLAGTA